MQRKEGGLRVIGVTGSSGKTTVKDMTAHVLAAKYSTFATSGNHNNHIGVPYTILHTPEETEIAVIEMGMNHAGEIDYLTHIASPDHAVITNIGTAHIGNLGSQENILKAKLEILNGMNGGSLIIPADDPLLRGQSEILADRVTLRYSSRLGDDKAELLADGIAESTDDTRFSVYCQGESADVFLPMTGLHNVTDALLAMSQNWQELFGYYIGIETVSPGEYQNRLSSGDYSIALYAVTSEYDGCYAAMKAYADRAELLGLENRYFGKLVEGLARPVSLADAASLCAEAEKTMIGTYTFIPLFYKNRYLIATAGNKDIVFDPFTGTADFIGAKYLPD